MAVHRPRTASRAERAHYKVVEISPREEAGTAETVLCHHPLGEIPEDSSTAINSLLQAAGDLSFDKQLG